MNRVARALNRVWWLVVGLCLVACVSRVTPPPTFTPVVPTTVAIPRSTASATLVIASSTPRLLTATPFTPVAARPTPRPHQFDDVDDLALLSAIFPDLKFTPAIDVFRVNDNSDWSMWIGSAVEGRFTQSRDQELAAIIANDAPRISAEQANRFAPWGSFLAIFQRRDGKLNPVQRAFLFPTALAPQDFQVTVDAAVDFDHDGQDELLLTTTTERLGVSTTAAFLYAWKGQAFVALWSSPIAEDNTGALNQADYFSIEARVELDDLDGNGLDEIIVDRTRIDYARDAQGLANTDQETNRQSERRVYRWDGAVFVLDPARTTPMPR